MSMKGNYRYLALLSVVLLTGCASLSSSPNTQHIVISDKAPPKDCEYRGDIYTNQGDYYSGVLIPVSILQKNAQEALRGWAVKKNANYVALIPQATTPTSALGTGGPDIAYHMQGTAYYCPTT